MKRKNIKELISEFFFINPTARLRVRQIERELKLPLPSVIRYCKELADENILTVQTISNVVFYTGDRTSASFLLEKRLFNIRSLYVSGLIDFLKFELSNPTIVLFGSYSRGEDTENSDIDLFIESPKNVSLNLAKFENILKRKIQPFYYGSLYEIKNTNLANNIINGITLNGFVEVFK